VIFYNQHISGAYQKISRIPVKESQGYTLQKPKVYIYQYGRGLPNDSAGTPNLQEILQKAYNNAWVETLVVL
jgi:hypothetical protein